MGDRGVTVPPLGSPRRLRVLVTGASGFVGGHVVRALLADRHQVGALLRQTSRAARFTRAFPDVQVLRIAADGRIPAEAIRAFRPEALIHLATESHPSCLGSGAGEAVRTNVLFAIDVLDCAIAGGCQSILNTGTQSQHRTGGPVYAPTDFYAASKQAFEDFLAAYRMHAGLSIVTLRLTDTYGPRDPRQRVLDLLLDAQTSGAPLLLSPGDQQVDLVHVSDVAAAFGLALRDLARRVPLQEAYGVASGRPLTLRELVALVEVIGGRRIDARWGAIDHRPGVIMKPFVPPPLPGWVPRVALEEGIAALAGLRVEIGAAS